MSATILWAPKESGASLDGVGSPSTCRETIEKVFGKLPHVFTGKDLTELSVLEKLGHLWAGSLAQEIVIHNTVVVWAEY